MASDLQSKNSGVHCVAFKTIDVDPFEFDPFELFGQSAAFKLAANFACSGIAAFGASGLILGEDNSL